MNAVPAARHLLRAKDLVDARYRDPLDVPALARTAHLSTAHFSREFRRVFGETPHQYLLMRRLERAMALMSKGAASGLFFTTEDCQASYEELKGRGVEFSQERTEQPYGVDAGFRDPSGNQMRMVQEVAAP
jgi:AraC-like DNA-binding protein